MCPLRILAATFATFMHLQLAALAADLNKIDRGIAREPKYESSPHYCLLVFGPDAKTRVWLVEDGKRLIVDRNANGDLTDDGEPVSATDERKFDTNNDGIDEPTVHDWDYDVGDIKPESGEAHTALKVMRWKYGKQPVNHGVLLNVGGKVPHYSGWGPVFAEKPEDAPIMHFGADYDAVSLRNKEIHLDKPPERFSIGFVAPGVGKHSSTLISIEALPETVVPQCEIEWPAKDDPSRTIRQSLPLVKRCCYWEFYNDEFKIPDGVGEGTVKVTVIVPGVLPFRFAEGTFELPVVLNAAVSK